MKTKIIELKLGNNPTPTRFITAGEGPEIVYITGPSSLYLQGLSHLQKQFTFVICADDLWTKSKTAEAKAKEEEKNIKESKPSVTTTLESLVERDKESIAAIREHYKRDKIGLMGFSAPGTLALKVALEIPEQIAWVNGTGIALYDLGLNFEKAAEAFKKEASKPRQAIHTALYKTKPKDFLESIQQLSPSSIYDTAYIPALWSLWARDPLGHVVSDEFRGHFFKEIQPKLSKKAPELLEQLAKQNKVPILLITGEQDFVTPMPKDIEKQLRTYSNITLKIYPRCAHNPFIETPERYYEDFCDFVASQSLLTSIKKHRWFFVRYLLALLATLALLGTGLYASLLAVPAISSALLSIGFSTGLAGLIALLPLMAGFTILLKFLDHNRALFGATKPNDLYSMETKTPVFEPFSLNRFFLNPFHDPLIDFENALMGYHKIQKDNPQHKKLHFGLLLYTSLAAFTALILSLYLSGASLVYLMTSIVHVTGISYAGAALLGISTIIAFFVLSYELLTAPMQLARSLLASHTWLQSNKREKPLLRIFQFLITAAGMGLAAYVSYLVFPWVVTGLLPVLPQASAIFVAVALCTGLLIATLTNLPKLVDLLAKGFGSKKESIEPAYDGLDPLKSSEGYGIAQRLFAAGTKLPQVPEFAVSDKTSSSVADPSL